MRKFANCNSSEEVHLRCHYIAWNKKLRKSRRKRWSYFELSFVKIFNKNCRTNELKYLPRTTSRFWKSHRERWRPLSVKLGRKFLQYDIPGYNIFFCVFTYFSSGVGKQCSPISKRKYLLVPNSPSQAFW